MCVKVIARQWFTFFETLCKPERIGWLSSSFLACIAEIVQCHVVMFMSMYFFCILVLAWQLMWKHLYTRKNNLILAFWWCFSIFWCFSCCRMVAFMTKNTVTSDMMFITKNHQWLSTLKFAGVPQTCQQISAVGEPKFTILWGHVREILLFYNFFFQLSIRVLGLRIWPDKVVQWCPDDKFLAFFASCIFSEPQAVHFRPAF